MRVDFYFTFKFILKVLIQTKLSIENTTFVDEIERIVIESLASLLIPILDNRSKVYWYLLKL